MKINATEEQYVEDAGKQMLTTPQKNAKIIANVQTVAKTTPHTPEHAKNGKRKKKS